MTRTEFIEQYRHEWGGMILDAATGSYNGSALSLFIRDLLRKVDKQLAKEYDALCPAQTLPVKAELNGPLTKELASGHAKR